ncbi:MAG: cysteine--tRNA ligase, partial [Fimbriimonadaceae bacterium]|nr:cysteine--tRNA ligase [Chitinophagales bacterium]
AMNNDFNSAQAIADLNEAASLINTWNDKQNKQAAILEHTLNRFKEMLQTFLFDVFGLKDDTSNNNADALNSVMNLVIDIRKDARAKKDFTTSDLIRDGLKAAGIQLKDGKEGTSWEVE